MGYGPSRHGGESSPGRDNRASIISERILCLGAGPQHTDLEKASLVKNPASLRPSGPKGGGERRV